MISESSSDADKARFSLLYMKLLYRVIDDADIIIATCQDAGSEDLYLNFEPTVVIIVQATQVTETEAFIPLFMYRSVRFRILLGNRFDVALPAEEPWSKGLVEQQMSLFERMEGTGVPVHDLTVGYAQQGLPTSQSRSQMSPFARLESKTPPVYDLAPRYPQHGHSKSVDVPPGLAMTPVVKPLFQTVNAAPKKEKLCRCGSWRAADFCACLGPAGKVRKLTRSESVPGRRIIPLKPSPLSEATLMSPL